MGADEKGPEGPEGPEGAGSNAEKLEELVAIGQADVFADLLAALEDEDGGDAAHAIFGGDLGICVDIELADFGFARVVVRDFFDNRRQSLTGAAPRCGEVYKDGRIGLQYVAVEILFRELKDVFASHGASLSAELVATSPAQHFSR